MFPTPIQRTSRGTQSLYRIALPIALIMWLLPLIAVALTSVRSAGDITAALVGTEVVVAGWVQHRRDHGGVVFVDLRDRDGLVQVVFKPDSSPECHERAGQLRAEYVILARGKVQRRSPETVNTKTKGGITISTADIG